MRNAFTPQQIHFYATRADLEPGLARAEANRPLKYVLSGLFAGSEFNETNTAAVLPQLGLAERGDVNRQPFYLVVDASHVVQVRAVPQRRGGVLYALDEVANPASVIFVPGGLNGNCVVVGKIMVPGDPRAHELSATFTPHVLRGFSRCGMYRIGPEARQLWESGYRLTHDALADPQFDLAKPVRQEN